MLMLRAGAGGAVVALLAATPAAAVATQVYTATFTLTSPTDSSTSGAVNSFSKSGVNTTKNANTGATIVAPGISVVATAWNATLDTTLNKYVIRQSYLGTYTQGLGVTSSVGDNINGYVGSYNCAGAGNCYTHQVDNLGTTYSATGAVTTSKSYDFVELTFNEAVTINTLTRYAFGTANQTLTGFALDDDFSYGAVTGSATPVTNNQQVTSLASLFTNSPSSTSACGAQTLGNTCEDTSTLSLLTPSKTWYIAASVLDNYGGDGIVDSFKVKALTVSYSVPEPATWATMVSGFGVVGGALRRRRRLAGPAAA